MSFYLIRKWIRRLPGIVIKAVPLPVPRLTEGFGQREQTGAICKEHGYRSVLLITDTTLFSLGYHENVMRSILDEGIVCSVFHDIASEPNTEIVCAGRTAARECSADCIVALGGGSVMDSSKIIAASAVHPRKRIGSYLGKFALAKTLPMITIPSTAGTGAEMTVGAVVKNRHGVKKATVIVGLQVTDVILDSELTLNAPEKVTACCGIDALSHGLEGCLADVRVSAEDEEKSRECVRIVLEDLPELIRDPKNIERRQRLCLAANYGGNAINKQLAGYVHAFAHTIGGYYHIPHGEAIAYCLLPVVEYQRNICAGPLTELARYCGLAGPDSDAAEAERLLFHALRELLDLCGFRGGLAKLKETDYPALVRGINADSINYSPSKTLSDKEIVGLLDEIKRGVAE